MDIRSGYGFPLLLCVLSLTSVSCDQQSLSKSEATALIIEHGLPGQVSKTISGVVGDITEDCGPQMALYADDNAALSGAGYITSESMPHKLHVALTPAGKNAVTRVINPFPVGCAANLADFVLYRFDHLAIQSILQDALLAKVTCIGMFTATEAGKGMQDKLNDVYAALIEKNPSRWEASGIFGFELYYFGYDFIGSVPETRQFTHSYQFKFEREENGWQIVEANETI